MAVSHKAEYINSVILITADDDCSHEIKRCLLLGRKVMTNLDSILKSRAIILSTKIRLVKAMVFPVVMYGCESSTIKKAECQRSDDFELRCWKRLFLLGRKAMTNLDSILKSRDITLPTKVHLVKAIVFQVIL